MNISATDLKPGDEDMTIGNVLDVLRVIER
jgi:hypothetical protein